MKDYRSFTLKKLNTPAFSHLKLLLFWPLHGLLFFLLERALPLQFHDVAVGLDAAIPFCEFFVIPYYLWFLFLGGMLVYLLFADVPGFRKYMWFVILSYSVTLLVYVIYPTSQSLRPDSFVRDNVFTWVVQRLYSFDTNTNVCPSLHVIGMMAVTFAGWKTPRMQHWGYKVFWVISCTAVCLSTVFLKQHSIVDVAAGLLVSVVVYVIVYPWNLFRVAEQEEPEQAGAA